jgi:hypothetical protein
MILLMMRLRQTLMLMRLLIAKKIEVDKGLGLVKFQVTVMTIYH